MTLPFMKQGDNITIVVDNTPYSITPEHMNYQAIRDAMVAGDWDAVAGLVDPVVTLRNFSQGAVEVRDGMLYWHGEPMAGAMAEKIVDMVQEGFDVAPMVAFMDNLLQNPSKRAVDELYGFLEAGNMPITPDGCFLAYKKVRDDYLDIHSGTMDNSVGKVVEMRRNLVDEDCHRTCSSGLHFCSQEYLPHFGGEGSRTMIVKVNPRDVVSIPSDYNNAKGRACRYEVVGELGVKASAAPEEALADAVIDPSQPNTDWY